MRWAPLLALPLAACFNPGEVDEGLFCDGNHDNACPEGQECGIDQRCHWATEDPCDLPYQCPDPSPGRVSICGDLYEIGSGDAIRADGANGTACDSFDPTASGPCALRPQIYWSSDFVSNPSSASSRNPEEGGLDDCGRFVAVGIDRPSDGGITIAFDDAPDSPAGDAYVPTATSFIIPADEAEGGVTLVATRRATDDDWTTSAGSPFGGASFSEQGVSLHLFLYQYEPASGVQVKFEDGIVGSGDAFYFADDYAYTHESIDPSAGSTGANGSALVVNRGLGTYSGTGNLPDGCEWEGGLSAALPGFIHYVEHLARDSSDLEEDCP